MQCYGDTTRNFSLQRVGLHRIVFNKGMTVVVRAS